MAICGVTESSSVRLVVHACCEMSENRAKVRNFTQGKGGGGAIQPLSKLPKHAESHASSGCSESSRLYRVLYIKIQKFCF